ncbi:MAG: DUF488 domain-containing protein [Microcoleus sp. PH2017_29_MFU_D_A]|uniref:DUF488 domain-containing protein n=1 Tax=unclassified Microcoleus TaxID=2642155 RepID=UPI001DC084CD|nr:MULTISPECIES: DUF488 domain-containing protein [unclassified Microcoleus]MCC3421147.1 DUF488 domain-containing protein [Microcoleus sp. PH2017_07_MST_O_A]MCC3443510.1 DUF488 domain-containing protein [Microcoleus sp. PH2017_03_ELD_O_A]MCC3469181.1 DUF488 domain-containing protein [Microcoleus sp. PH2017_06_SFM_O_A]MCC3506388.1 DUF488 domain-containing protein [Microcoleus sp. PH2017_19_SFW_U_A]MCC3509482.1 DUF488 domain-containing protein [Microcoleus sp. PH2017_17_BER_D_A]TAE08910.1 MAG: 
MSPKKAINLFTIGFTQKSAEQFFDTLIKAGVRRVIDTRLNNVSQLAGFAKRKDLEYFLRTIGNIKYVHILDLAPTQDILDDYKKKKGDWDVYEQQFLQLIRDRQIEQKISPDILDCGCLLCSEPQPHNCHRRLVAEYLNDKWQNVKISHL